MHEAKSQLSKLVEAVMKGEEIIIANRDKPVARLIMYEATEKPDRSKLFGCLKDAIPQKTIDYLSDSESDEAVARDFYRSIEEDAFFVNEDKPSKD